MSSNNSNSIFALASKKKSPSSINKKNPLYTLDEFLAIPSSRTLTTNQKIGIGAIIFLVILAIVFLLHWFRVYTIPYLPASTQKKEKSNNN